MRHRSRRLAAIARAAAVAALALTLTTPVSAQFGGLKKKLRAAAATDAATQAAPNAPAGTADEVPEPGPAGGTGGIIVLDAEVVGRLIAGLKAAAAEREAAAKADTPYGRFRQALEAYEVAQPKCEQGRRTFPERMASNEKLSNRYNALVTKMVEAQGRGDQRTAMAYNDSASAMQDPACTVKQPEAPEEYYQAERELNDRAERSAMKESGFSRSDLSQVRERVETALRNGTAPGNLSASEKSAVSARAAELKPLLGIRDEPPPAPAPATARTDSTPAAAMPAAAIPAGSNEMAACFARNAEKHQKRLEALGKRAEAAQKVGDTEALLAVADTIQQLQTAGCTGAR